MKYLIRHWLAPLGLLPVILCLWTVFARGDEVKTYSGHGVIEQIAPDRGHVTIHHQAIPGYMMEMTMDFPVKTPADLAGLAVGDEITFTLAVTEKQDWIEHLQLVAHHVGRVTNQTFVFHSPVSELGPGDFLPDYPLTTEAGKPAHFSDFTGRAVAFTFFFTRCPLPDYCLRMNNNFAATREILRSTTNAPANWQFISISFDPEFDTPQTLVAYARLYRRGDADRWLFASVSKQTLATLAASLDLMVLHQGAGISHNLRTVVLDPQGRIFRQFDGNNWTPQQLADAMLAAARKTDHAGQPMKMDAGMKM